MVDERKKKRLFYIWFWLVLEFIKPGLACGVGGWLLGFQLGGKIGAGCINMVEMGSCIK